MAVALPYDHSCKPQKLLRVRQLRRTQKLSPLLLFFFFFFFRVRLLFFDLFLLGIDSAFSFVEGFSTVARDTEYFHLTPKWQIAGVLCLVGWLISLMYTSDAGFAWLDVIDFYINFTMLIVGFFESKWKTRPCPLKIRCTVL